MAEFIFPNSAKLTGSENFDIWYSTIMDYLEAKNLLNRGIEENELVERLQAIRKSRKGRRYCSNYY